MLAVRSLSVRYRATVALVGLDLDLAAGEIVCVLGANGAGKTSLVRAIAGQVRPAAGTVHLHGQLVTGLGPAAIARRGIVQCPEGRKLFGRLTVEENLLLGASRRRIRRLRPEMDLMLDLFPRLRERRRQKAGTLSGGEQQMVALARSFIAHPDVLLLDEPALGLSPKLVRQLFSILPEIASRGTAILLVEQSAQAALAVAARGLLLRNGIVVLRASAAVMARRLRLPADAPCDGALPHSIVSAPLAAQLEPS